MTALLLERFLGGVPEKWLHPVLRNWNGIEVGALRPAAGLTT